MTQHYEAHAEKVVAGFKDILGDELVATLGDEHFAELAMLIESAIGTSVVTELERAADQVAELATKLRKHAETYD
jgi:predicted Co/Zn/Cd cation transporter (cation efflux family)